MSISKVRTAVVGVGHFGHYHADKYAVIPGVELVGVVDINLARASEIGAQHGVPGYNRLVDVLDRVDAVSIATPATSHYRIAKTFLERGVHVLVEKPISTTLAEADELIGIAEDKGLILQVGHQERFFVEQLGIAALAGEPIEIECRRVGPFSGRSMDCNVVLDLMIHDIDLVHQMIASPFGEVSAFGEALHGSHEDDVAATLLADNGCKISLHASRVSEERERWIKFTSPSGSLDIDFIDRRMVHRQASAEAGVAGVINGDDSRSFQQEDLLAIEIGAFVESVRSGKAPMVGGQDGRRALETALMINHSIQPWPGAEARVG